MPTALAGSRPLGSPLIVTQGPWGSSFSSSSLPLPRGSSPIVQPQPGRALPSCDGASREQLRGPSRGAQLCSSHARLPAMHRLSELISPSMPGPFLLGTILCSNPHGAARGSSLGAPIQLGSSMRALGWALQIR